MAKLTNDAIMEIVAWRCAYYRANIHRFAKDYLGLNLKTFQKMLLFQMDRGDFSMYLAGRSQGKTWMAGVFSACRCILYPGTIICIASGARKQSIKVLQKITNQLANVKGSMLQSEIVDYKLNSNDAYIQFRNGSIIQVVTANDRARSERSNILILDEFRMIRKDIIDVVLRKFNGTPRMPAFLDNNPEYVGNPEKRLAYLEAHERNKEVYLSSAFYESHWSYAKAEDYFRQMLDAGKRYFICDLPYQLSIEEGLLLPSAVKAQMEEADFNELSFSMEMEGRFYRDTGGNFFDYDTISRSRKVIHAWMPPAITAKLKDKGAKGLSIPPKQRGEVRILSMDVALLASRSHKNDATAIFINQCQPISGQRYMNSIVYGEAFEGVHTADQALRVRKLFDVYDCDYIALDGRNFGASIYDALARDIVDDETGIIYPPLSCCNNADYAARCKDPTAKKAVWVILGNAKINSECAVGLRQGFRDGRIRLPVTEEEVDDVFSEETWYAKLSPYDKLKLQEPYINTTELVYELVRLETDTSGGVIKVSEQSGDRKDRYSSLSYNIYVSQQLEYKLRARPVTESRDEPDFVFRPPKIRGGSRAKSNGKIRPWM